MFGIGVSERIVLTIIIAIPLWVLFKKIFKEKMSGDNCNRWRFKAGLVQLTTTFFIYIWASGHRPRVKLKGLNDQFVNDYARDTARVLNNDWLFSSSFYNLLLAILGAVAIVGIINIIPKSLEYYKNRKSGSI